MDGVVFAPPSIAGVLNVNAFGNLSGSSRAALLAVIALVGAGLFWGRDFIPHADGQAVRKDQTATLEAAPSSAASFLRRILSVGLLPRE